jgi:tetratricopeptide (TPR) repeat protein
MLTLPFALETSLEAGNTVLFLGAGLGHYMRRPDGSTMPDARNLARAMATRFNLDVEDSGLDLAKISSIVELRHRRDHLISFLRESLAGYKPDDELKWLLGLTWKAIFTTNYDASIEDTYAELAVPTQTPVSMATNSEIRSWDPAYEIPVFHLHGALSSELATDAVLLTERDYALYSEKRNMLFDHFKVEYPTAPILYIGYSNNDPNWREITTTLQKQFSPGVPPKSYRLAPTTSNIDRELLESQGIETVDGTIADLHPAVVSRIGDLRVEPIARDRLRASVPSDLLDTYQQYPSATARLLNSWEYVNQADFSSQPNTESFLRGNRANWGVFGNGVGFERDLEEPLKNRLLDFVTSPSPPIESAIVLGPAGYGVSTLLLAAAAWYVREKAGPILLLREGATAFIGDVEFATKQLNQPPVFVIDNAADHREQIADIVGTLRRSGSAGFFLLGARLNEWHQLKSFWTPTELVIDPLSDDEISRLIHTLEREGQLGRLADLPPGLQHAAIKERNQKELLVTMREVTEGRAFDVIIESEYWNITDQRARDLYGLVCGLSRARVIGRDQLFAEAMGLQLQDVYDLLRSLEGIVIETVLDDAREIDGLRSRHQTIAEIVWDRCLNDAQRESALLDVLEALNLTYAVDLKAFESLTRDEYAIDNLRSFDTRVRFFERAARKDPDNVYVRQHFARMLRREGKLEMALAQIDVAIKMAPRKRLLHHTKGMILGDLATSAESREIGRRFLGQAEQAFDQALSIDERDEYSYQSLADLYLDWAKKVDGGDERAIYLAKAQEALLDGLEKGRELEYLYVMEARIQEYIGNTPGQLEALRNAFDESPTSSNVRYLLGNALRAAGELEESETVLHDGMLQNTGDPRLALSYVKTLLALKRELGQVCSVLELTRSRGLRDPSYIATYSGLLKVSGRSVDADRLLDEVKRKSFSATDSRRIVFVPSNHIDFPVLDGTVTRVAPGFAFVNEPKHGDFFFPGFRIRDRILRPGDQVRFVAGFTVRGGVVYEVLDNARSDSAGAEAS